MPDTQLFTNKKIIIYGSGIRAKRFIEEYKNYVSISGVLDKNMFCGDILGIPIVTWDIIDTNSADCIVIAATEKHVREIYCRILYDCDREGFAIYDWHGVDLRKAFRYDFIMPHVKTAICASREKTLYNALHKYDVISFDLFDTLIMRKSIEPEDVYSLVDLWLPVDSPLKNHFKSIRRDAEIKSNAIETGFENIYSLIKKVTNIGDEQIRAISEYEIECEKRMIIPRNEVLKIFNYAISIGKKVNIITDMYYGKSILVDLLNRLGITGYNDIYVSCEYKKSKCNGLYEIYMNNNKFDTYLHIGDNYDDDIYWAEKYGMNTFYIPSALELARASDLRRLLLHAKGDFNRYVLGEFISNVFNNPFCICGTNGFVSIDTANVLGKNIIAPIIYKYLKCLKNYIKRKHYDKILLGSRDCYLFYKLLKNDNKVNSEKVVYFYTSRTLAYKLGMGNPIVDEDYKKYLAVDKRRELIKDEEFLLGNTQIPYKRTKDGFYKYLLSNEISDDGKYLFCDLISGGTIQHSLNPLFKNKLDGFYLGRTHYYLDRNINVVSIFDRRDVFGDEKLVNRLETLVCSPEPTVVDINNDGSLIFDEENRSSKEIDLLEKIQDDICDGVKDLESMETYFNSELNEYLCFDLIYELGKIEMKGELKTMKNWIYKENNGEFAVLFE